MESLKKHILEKNKLQICFIQYKIRVRELEDKLQAGVATSKEPKASAQGKRYCTTLDYYEEEGLQKPPKKPRVP